MKLIDYNINEKYNTKVAYFSMEFAIDQAFKNYSGGLGFLAGSHLKSANDLRQNTIGVGLLWSYGYYDQNRHEDRTLKIDFLRKFYYFIEDLDIKVTVLVNSEAITVKAYLLPSTCFDTAPLILLSTDIFENDYLSRTITHKLYDANEETRIAQEIVLGIGGVKVLEALGQKIDIYHLNEGHALPLAFKLLENFGSLEEVKKKVVFTTHTPEIAGNEEHDIELLGRMGFFNGFKIKEIKRLFNCTNDSFSLTIGALKVSKIANAVSKIHAKVANEMWKNIENKCEIIDITNAQNMGYWADKQLLSWFQEHEEYQITGRKKHLKRLLFEEVADQTGKIFDPNILTIIWARRFAEYKRPWLLTYDMQRFKKLINNTKRPVQIIWAGKPYPLDYRAVNMFNELIKISKEYKNVAVLIGYELRLSKLLKQGGDIWLNTPRYSREASGTSGMSAVVNACVHFSINDGWHNEFYKDGINSFTIHHANTALSIEDQDREDYENMMNILENEIIPIYYDDEKKWLQIIQNGMNDIKYFDSSRMVREYYEKVYNK